MKQLDVFMGAEQIGYLRERDDGVLIFGYNSAWLATGKAVALSPELPLRNL